MSFTFVHTADWQIGKPFGAFPSEMQFLLREARLDAIGRIAQVAAASGAAHVLVAGDVFDNANPPSALINQTLGRLARHAGLVWHLLPGNHDPVQPGTVWDALRNQSTAPNIRLHLSADPVEIAPGVVVLPAPLKAKALAHDPTAYMDGLETGAGKLRIGFAHGSVQGFGGQGDANVPISPTRDRAARLDYLALGDWHGRTRISDRTWYSGTPEPDGFKDNDPGTVLVVTLPGGGAAPLVRPVATQEWTWLQDTIDVSTDPSCAGVSERIARLTQPLEHRIARISARGVLGLDGLASLEAARARVEASVRYLDWDQSALRIRAGDDAAAILGSATLAAIAGRLQGEVDTQGAANNPERATVAAEALTLLTAFAREVTP